MRHGLLLLLLGLAGCQRQPPPAAPPPKAETERPAGQEKPRKLMAYPNREFTPGLAAVLANPERFHGKKIQIEGFLHVEFEGTAVYLCKEHADYLITENGLWVDFDPQAVEVEQRTGGPAKLHRKWVLLEGTFDNVDRGHMGGWSGTLTKVDRVMECTRYYTD
jgi:hypothetical protein